MTRWEVIEADFFDAIETVKPNTVKAAIMDPPYMIGNVSAAEKSMIDPWSDMMNGSRFYRDVLNAVRKKLVRGGAVWLFINWRGLPSVYKAACDANWTPAGCLVWSKAWPGPGNLLRASHELCVAFTEDGFERANAKTLDVMECKPVPTANRVHPAQKPVELMERIVRFTTKPDDVVLDGFCGSGSTGVAAVKLGRRFVGIEMNHKFADIARRRIQEETSKMTLWEDE